MKPFQLILTAAFVIFAIIGLLVFAGANPSNNKNVIGDVVIWGTLPKEAVRETLASVREIRTDFDGVTYIEVSLDEFHTTYTEALAVDRGPDLILVPHTLLLAEAGTLSPISVETIPARDFEDTFIDGADIVIANGYYGVPVGIDPLVMYFNKAMLNNARVSEAPKFWEQFTGLVPRFVETAGGFSIEKSFVALGAYENITHAEKILASFFFQVGSPIRGASGQVELVGGENEDVESALRFYTEFANPNTSAYSWNKSLKEDRQAFLANDLAIYFAPASEGKSLALANPNISIGSAAFPQLEGGNSVVYGDVYVFATPKDARNVTAAKTAALAFTGKNVAEVFAQVLNMAPVRRDLVSTSQNDPLLDLAYDEAFIAKGWLSPQPARVDTVFSAMVDDVVSGRSDALDALTKAQRSLK
tara:strand:- start:16963 stop:18213 length:1251 start_codon:yes stop_codon:yes gene_type:complete